MKRVGRLESVDGAEVRGELVGPRCDLDVREPSERGANRVDSTSIPAAKRADKAFKVDEWRCDEASLVG